MVQKLSSRLAMHTAVDLELLDLFLQPPAQLRLALLDLGLLNRRSRISPRNVVLCKPIQITSVSLSLAQTPRQSTHLAPHPLGAAHRPRPKLRQRPHLDREEYRPANGILDGVGVLFPEVGAQDARVDRAGREGGGVMGVEKVGEENVAL